ncbi:MAG: trigger factor [Clostridiales bacterium]|nr:trigger factor [Clostridiales bacterium]
MNVQIEKLEGNMAKVTIVEEDAAIFDAAVEKVYRKQVKNINIPGFRKGKAPRKMIEKMYGEGVFWNDALDEVFPELYSKALEENPDLKVTSMPALENVEFKPLTIVVNVAVKPEVTLGEYKGMEVNVEVKEISDEDVDAAIAREQKKNARKVEVERAIENGDEIVFDFAGTVDGVAFEGGKAEDYELKIGSGQFIPGFEEQLVGVKAGESKDVVVTFPEDYHAEDLAGKEAVFACTVKSVMVEELPEIDDELASDAGHDSVEEWKKAVKAELEENEAKNLASSKENAALAKAVENADMIVPEPMVEEEVKQMADEYAQQLAQSGLSLEQYIQFTGGSKEDFLNSLHPQALNRIESRLVLEAIAKAEGFEATDEDVDAEIAEMAKMYGMEADKIKEILGDAQLEAMKENLVCQKAVKLLGETAVIVEAAEEEAAEAEEE